MNMAVLSHPWRIIRVLERAGTNILISFNLLLHLILVYIHSVNAGFCLTHTVPIFDNSPCAVGRKVEVLTHNNVALANCVDRVCAPSNCILHVGSSPISYLYLYIIFHVGYQSLLGGEMYP